MHEFTYHLVIPWLHWLIGYVILWYAVAMLAAPPIVVTWVLAQRFRGAIPSAGYGLIGLACYLGWVALQTRSALSWLAAPALIAPLLVCGPPLLLIWVVERWWRRPGRRRDLGRGLLVAGWAALVTIAIVGFEQRATTVFEGATIAFVNGAGPHEHERYFEVVHPSGERDYMGIDGDARACPDLRIVYDGPRVHFACDGQKWADSPYVDFERRQFDVPYLWTRRFDQMGLAER